MTSVEKAEGFFWEACGCVLVVSGPGRAALRCRGRLREFGLREEL